MDCRLQVYAEPSRLLTVHSGTNTATYSYLANSRLVSQVFLTNGNAWRMTTTKTYDYLDRLLGISSVSSASSVVSYGYSYNAANQRTSRLEADNSRWSFNYDPLGQVTSGKRYWSDQTPVAGQQFEYAFDDTGNRTGTKAGGDENGANPRSASYYPNLLNQYWSNTVPGAVDVMGIALATNSVTVNGNSVYRKGEYFRKELTVNNASAPVWQEVTVAATNETSITRHEYVPRTPEAFVHDEDGNLTQDGRWNYYWDAENRLTAMTNIPSAPVAARMALTFAYDWQGRRIEKIVYTNSAGSWFPSYTNRFVYDGWNLIARFDGAGNLLQTYVWGLDLSGTLQGAGGVGGLLFVSEISNSQISNTYAPAYDGNGNVMALVNMGDGTLTARYEYGPFGEVLRATGPMAKDNPIRFSTKYQDDETDLLYYGYRYYAASMGKWPSKDPIDERGGLNLYGFSKNDPIKNADRLGKDCIDPCGLAKQLGLGGTDWKEQGGVVCCLGRKYACVWNTRPFVGRAEEIVAGCVFDHESSHFNDIPDCPVCNFWPSRPKYNKDKDAAECPAYRRSVRCYKSALDNGLCGGDFLCEGMIRIALGEAQDNATKHCKAVKPTL